MHRANLVSWLKAAPQALPHLENDEDVLSHACGEYVLKELQRDITPLAVQASLLKEYLVSAFVQRIKPYRRYREQRGEYWTVELLERNHWQFLYEQVSLEARTSRWTGPRRSEQL